MKASATLYSESFYEEQRTGSLLSARSILPIVTDLVSPASVIDVGCGVGTWLSVANALEIHKCLGLDGNYVDRSALLIDPKHFQPVELSEPLPDVGRFDLAICLEVAEHLPPKRGPELVKDLVRLAPAVLFSAAIPGQSGTGHINEQWQDYWIDLFLAENYVLVDCVRPAVWNKAEVEYWYAQNTVLMVSRELLASSRALQSAHAQPAMPTSVVHPRAFIRSTDEIRMLRSVGLKGWIKEGPTVLKRTLLRRFQSAGRGS